MQPINAVVSPEGKLPPYVSKLAQERISALAGRHIKIKIWEAQKTASESQREYYFAVIVPAYVNHFALEGKRFDKEQMHDSMMRFIGGFSNPYVNPFTGEPDAGRLSYNDLTVAQCEGYHTLCRKWAAENGFDIPEPSQ